MTDAIAITEGVAESALNASPVGLVSGVGSALGGVASAFGQHMANKTNMAIANKQMKFQERMSNTAYQRATADMRAAGLNPMLAHASGGASTPGGASTTVGNALEPAVNSAVKTGEAIQEIKNLQEAGRNLRADRMHTEIATKKVELETQGLAIDNFIKSLGMPAAEAKEKVYTDFWKGASDAYDYLKGSSAGQMLGDGGLATGIMGAGVLGKGLAIKQLVQLLFGGKVKKDSLSKFEGDLLMNPGTGEIRGKVGKKGVKPYSTQQHLKGK